MEIADSIHIPKLKKSFAINLACWLKMPTAGRKSKKRRRSNGGKARKEGGQEITIKHCYWRGHVFPMTFPPSVARWGCVTKSRPPTIEPVILWIFFVTGWIRVENLASAIFPTHVKSVAFPDNHHNPETPRPTDIQTYRTDQHHMRAIGIVHS